MVHGKLNSLTRVDKEIYLANITYKKFFLFKTTEDFVVRRFDNWRWVSEGNTHDFSDHLKRQMHVARAKLFTENK